MTAKPLSLRTRLFGLVLLPLCVVAAPLGYWRYQVAQQTAETLFDRSLLIAALAISRDVAVSGGDALLPSTRDLISDASGGEIFYHVTGPDGVYVTGYGYPPVERRDAMVVNGPRYSDGNYRDETVRVLRITEATTVDGLSGDATITVWQRRSDRNVFVRRISLRAGALIGVLLATLAVVIWFGVGLGLRPLRELHEAIARRSPNDLNRIRRLVPIEIQGIVATLNHLFRKLDESIAAHQAFVSDAAHQLRNPAAGILSMAEALRETRSDAERNSRLDALVEAARSAARVTEQFLSLEQLKQGGESMEKHPVVLDRLVEEICADFGGEILRRGIALELAAGAGDSTVHINQVFFSEALKNLLDNALKHGGPFLSKIVVSTKRQSGMIRVSVRNDGNALAPTAADTVLRRFAQLGAGPGAGLGLAVADTVARRHGGYLEIDRVASGAGVSIFLPETTSCASPQTVGSSTQ